MALMRGDFPPHLKLRGGVWETMKPIVTLTLNPTIDAASKAETVRPTHKVRTFDERYDPGGGGINVARVINELGGRSLAVYLAGGLTGGRPDRRRSRQHGEEGGCSALDSADRRADAGQPCRP